MSVLPPTFVGSPTGESVKDSLNDGTTFGIGVGGEAVGVGVGGPTPTGTTKSQEDVAEETRKKQEAIRVAIEESLLIPAQAVANASALAEAKDIETGRGRVFFSEQRQGAHPAYYVSARVFVSGVEVTNFLTGTISFTYAGRDGHNTASFTLQSAEDNFIITYANAPGLKILEKDYVTTTTDEKSTVTQAVVSVQQRTSVQQSKPGRWRVAPDMPLYSEHAKKAIYEYKDQVGVKAGRARNPVLELDGQQQATATTSKDNFCGSRTWPLQANRPIFHKNDPVRIFIHNPLHHPTDDSDEQWLPAFAGFIEGYPWTEDYLTGHKDITISCYDLRALMRYMRVVNISPQQTSLGNSPAGRELNLLRKYFGTEAGSMFLLMELGTMNKNLLAGLSFETAVSFLVVGEKTPLLEKNGSGALGSQAKLTPVGPLFSMGQVLRYGGTASNLEGIGKHSTSSGDLDDWHTLCLCGPRDLSRYGVTGSRPDPFLSSTQVEQLGKHTVWWEMDGTPGLACPANQQLHMLLPGGGTVFDTLYSKEMAGPSMENVDLDYTDRFTLINDICNVLDYQWMVTPFGDLIFEFPMYDFFPTPGDRVPGSVRTTTTGTAPSNAGPSDKRHMGFNKWAGALSLDWHLTSASYNEESGEITTVLFADGPLNLFGDHSSTGSFINRSMLFVPTLLRRLGAVTATQNFPFIKKKTAICRAGLLELRRRLARVSTMEAQFIYRPFILPNRPLYVAPRQRCGNISSVTHTLEINANAGTSASLQYIRQRDQFGNWTHVTGAENMPLDFTLMSDYANFANFAKNNWVVDGICAPCLDEAGAPGGPAGSGPGSSPSPPKASTKYTVGNGLKTQVAVTDLTAKEKKFLPWFRNMRPEVQSTFAKMMSSLDDQFPGRVAAGYTYNAEGRCPKPGEFNPHLGGIAVDFNLKDSSGKNVYIWALNADGTIAPERVRFFEAVRDQAHVQGMQTGMDWRGAGGVPPEFTAAAHAQWGDNNGADPPHVQYISDKQALAANLPTDYQNPGHCPGNENAFGVAPTNETPSI